MAPPVVADEPCVFNKIGERFCCPASLTLLDDVPCFSSALACDHFLHVSRTYPYLVGLLS
jgi:hypothetical protein